MFDDGAYLRIFAPITSNGKDLVIKGDRVQYKESFAPLTAKKQLDKENLIRPQQLKHKIEIVDPYATPPPVIPVVKHIPTPAEIAAVIDAENKSKAKTVKPAKPRPKKKKYVKKAALARVPVLTKTFKNTNDEEFEPID